MNIIEMTKDRDYLQSFIDNGSMIEGMPFIFDISHLFASWSANGHSFYSGCAIGLLNHRDYGIDCYKTPKYIASRLLGEHYAAETISRQGIKDHASLYGIASGHKTLQSVVDMMTRMIEAEKAKVTESGMETLRQAAAVPETVDA